MYGSMAAAAAADHSEKAQHEDSNMVYTVVVASPICCNSALARVQAHTNELCHAR
jgi:hypothetical protein